MAFWKKSEEPWDIDPNQRRTASEPAEKAPGLLDTLRGDWDAMRAEWQETRESLKLPPEKCPWCGNVGKIVADKLPRHDLHIAGLLD